MSHTWMRNPDTGGEWECPDLLVDVYTARGWEVMADAPAEAESHLKDFDPAEHTAAEVKQHLEDAAPEEAAAVVEAEKSSKKPRKSITGE